MIFNPVKYTKRIEELEQLVQERDSDIIALREEVTNYKRTIASFPGVKQDFEDKVSSLNKKHESALKTLKEENDAKVYKLECELRATKKSVASQVNLELASLGIPISKAAKEETISGESDLSEVLVNLNALTGNDRTEYYRKNEEKITHALQKLSKH